MRNRTIRAYGRRGPGLTQWQSREELARARRRTIWVAAGLAVLALFWLAAFADPTPDPDGDGDLILGIVILELFTLVPLAVALWRIRRLGRLLRRVDSVSEDDQEATARAVRAREEAVWRVGRLVDGLPPGPIRDAAADALAAGHAANESRRRLHHRVSQLEHLMAVTTRPSARGRLEQARTACQRDLAELDDQVEEMAASVADLVDAAATAAPDAELARVRDATERVAALAAAMRELDQLS